MNMRLWNLLVGILQMLCAFKKNLSNLHNLPNAQKPIIIMLLLLAK